jgi:hypothetical protein
VDFTSGRYFAQIGRGHLNEPGLRGRRQGQKKENHHSARSRGDEMIKIPKKAFWGAIIGGVAGLLYYFVIGCRSGS